jgi:hypothetical protein
MDAVSFVREKQRMCSSFGDLCDIHCPLKDMDWGCMIDTEKADPDMVVERVEKWSKEHSLVTNGVQMEELLPPNTTIREGFKRIFIEVPRDWWDAEYKGM